MTLPISSPLKLSISRNLPANFLEFIGIVEFLAKPSNEFIPGIEAKMLADFSWQAKGKIKPKGAISLTLNKYSEGWKAKLKQSP